MAYRRYSICRVFQYNPIGGDESSGSKSDRDSSNSNSDLEAFEKVFNEAANREIIEFLGIRKKTFKHVECPKGTYIVPLLWVFFDNSWSSASAFVVALGSKSSLLKFFYNSM